MLLSGSPSNGSIILMLDSPIELPAQIYPQSRGPEHCFGVIEITVSRILFFASSELQSVGACPDTTSKRRFNRPFLTSKEPSDRTVYKRLLIGVQSNSVRIARMFRTIPTSAWPRTVETGSLDTWRLKRESVVAIGLRTVITEMGFCLSVPEAAHIHVKCFKFKLGQLVALFC